MLSGVKCALCTLASYIQQKTMLHAYLNLQRFTKAVTWRSIYIGTVQSNISTRLPVDFSRSLSPVQFWCKLDAPNLYLLALRVHVLLILLANVFLICIVSVICVGSIYS